MLHVLALTPIIWVLFISIEPHLAIWPIPWKDSRLINQYNEVILLVCVTLSKGH